VIFDYRKELKTCPMTPYDVHVEGKTIQIPKWQGWAKSAKAKLDEMITKEAA